MSNGGAMRNCGPAATVPRIHPVPRNGLSALDRLAQVHDIELHRIGKRKRHATRRFRDACSCGEISSEHRIELVAEGGELGNIGLMQQAVPRGRDVEQEVGVPAHRHEIELDQLVGGLHLPILCLVPEPSRPDRDIRLAGAPDAAGRVAVLQHRFHLGS